MERMSALRIYHGRTALHSVAKYGDETTVELLASKGANVNALDRWGRTALMLATENNRTRTVQILLKTGADVDIKARHGVTALHMAAFVGYQPSVRYLLQGGANANLVASWCEAEDAVDKELDAMGTTQNPTRDFLRESCLEQADVEEGGVETRYGWTARQLAARGDQIAIQRLLDPSGS